MESFASFPLYRAPQRGGRALEGMVIDPIVPAAVKVGLVGITAIALLLGGLALGHTVTPAFLSKGASIGLTGVACAFGAAMVVMVIFLPAWVKSEKAHREAGIKALRNQYNNQEIKLKRNYLPEWLGPALGISAVVTVFLATLAILHISPAVTGSLAGATGSALLGLSACGIMMRQKQKDSDALQEIFEKDEYESFPRLSDSSDEDAEEGDEDLILDEEAKDKFSLLDWLKGCFVPKEKKSVAHGDYVSFGDHSE